MIMMTMIVVIVVCSKTQSLCQSSSIIINHSQLSSIIINHGNYHTVIFHITNNIFSSPIYPQSLFHFISQQYVQDLIRKNSDDVCELILLNGGHVYVCGDVSMAADVSKTLLNLLQEFAALSQVEAQELIATLRVCIQDRDTSRTVAISNLVIYIGLQKVVSIQCFLKVCIELYRKSTQKRKRAYVCFFWLFSLRRALV